MRIKILYFHHAIGMGGAPKSLALLIEGLDKNEFEPIVVMPRRAGNDTVKQLFKKAGAEVVEEQHIRPFNGVNGCPCNTFKSRAFAILAAIPTMLSTRKQVRNIRPDVVHVNTIVLPFSGVGVKSAFLGIPVVTHVRETLLATPWGRFLGWLNKQFTDYFIGIDQSGLDAIGLEEGQGEVIYNFINLTEFAPRSASIVSSIRNQHNWREDQTIFLSLSRIAESNGAMELGELVAKTHGRLNPNALFVVAGFHENASGYEAETKEYLQSSPRFQTLNFSQDVVGLISASDVIIAPFTKPHSARSVFEGAAIGKPAIVTNHPNLCELILEGETGYSFELSDEDKFVEIVNKFCEKETQVLMGQNSRRLAAQEFDQEKNISRTAKVYRKFIDRN